VCHSRFSLCLREESLHDWKQPNSLPHPQLPPADVEPHYKASESLWCGFSRDYYGYLLRASDYKLVAYGKFTVRNRAGRLVLHVAPGQYVSFSVVYRSKAPTVASSKFRRITVK
jgi:hypothetical protein